MPAPLSGSSAYATWASEMRQVQASDEAGSLDGMNQVADLPGLDT
jgi:hypothetical protein